MQHSILKNSWPLLYDTLKDTWPYQEVRKVGLGRALLRFVEIRFPPLLTLAKWAIEQEMSLEQFEKKLITLYQANTIEEATLALLTKGK